MKKTGCFLNCSYLSFLNCCCFLNCLARVTKKLKKVICFTFLPVTLQKNTWKNQIRVILYFWLKNGGLKQANGSLEPFRPSASPWAEKNLGCHLPAFDPHFPTWKYKITAHLVFPTVFRNCYWKKVKQNTINWMK